MSDIDAAAGRYTTIAGEHRSELDVKRSRFITVLQRTETEEEARALVAGLRREFHDARHHCSAFVLGATRSVQRSNDDGEPSGTAGIPMLEALTKRETFGGATDLSDITAVTVRYFGGILLGAGGLVRAYSESVSSALAAAPLLRRRRMQLYAVPASHADAGRLENELRSAGISVTGTDYGTSGASITVALPDVPGTAEEFRDRLAALTAGGSTPEPLRTEWIDL
ncbi:IMPACT family protein [Arthrobacter sp. zg-Y20]|uniref:IMPACT family protein n=1 Tax=unclassified Arthrobacter TaxID=235627 RepID=UPI001D13B947|nr:MULTISPECIES: YigZ family protein [unclassified Arthrobacter]MCC3274681.1 IMPACT family protein [Arthrobacter sp. zg-Y20]MDK1314837.1 YigZ family protein [Arthrobacter sp. zg.Y20]WIB04699.1 YigZ family protein [Arthrobacter sp. zg-Y20]